ncbi:MULTISPECIES: hypothetical protein [Methylobacterium]|uniref:hypothetical protein n=1 Tax=Methylobacterium TaxID=407 RepID=UPI0005DACBA5|nr:MULTISPECIES: hypothetical protein [Methylobacterium]MBN6820321.1 hypothetical protein [Methylobacterium organophilum]GAN50132.1 multi-sensor hybrid histidine kinase [Methylobacterium sp. ME121]
MAFSEVGERVLFLLARDMPPLLQRSNRFPLTGGMRPPHGIVQCYEILPAMNDSAAASPGSPGDAAVQDTGPC